MREYKIFRQIAAGGMGRVYQGIAMLADDMVFPVAIKISNAESHDVELRAMFLNESKTATMLNHNHPHLVTVFDIGETPDQELFLVMELVDGASAGELCERQPLSAAIVQRTALAMLHALAYLHTHGVMHRDVAPGNILLGRDGRIQLGDFGLARRPTGSHSGPFQGTPAYASPEQLRGAALTPASDLFSLGAVLCKLATAKEPFGTGYPAEVLRSMEQGIAAPLDDLPDALRRLITGLLRRACGRCCSTSAAARGW